VAVSCGNGNELWVPQNGTNFLLAEKLLAFKKNSSPCNFSLFVLFLCLFFCLSVRRLIN
jgi:hypothetical protein